MITREKKSRIVDDLARGHRTPKAIADRHGVSVDVVVGLRDELGPELPKLIEAAERLRRPEPITRPEPEPVKLARPKLGPAERAACRAWALSQNRPCARGPLPFDVVDAWLAAGRPEASTYDPDELAPEPDGDEDDVESAAPVDVAEYIVATEELVDELLNLPDAETVDDGPHHPVGKQLLEFAQTALTDVGDAIAWAVENMPADVWAWVQECDRFTSAVGAEGRVDAAAQVLYELHLQQLLGDREAITKAARLALAAAESA